MEKAEDILPEVLKNIVVQQRELPPLECGAARWVGSWDPGVTFCMGAMHMNAAGVLGRCPEARKAEIRARVESERKRLAGPLAVLALKGGVGFSGFDWSRNESAAKALGAMRRFSEGRPPISGVLLTGPTGLGKTRLLLASHFALLEAGVNSEYVTSPALRRLFRDASSFTEEVAETARGQLDRLVYASAVHADDLGDVEDDQRARGQFTEGIKDLLDRSRAVWAFAVNLSSEEAERHPDLSGKVVSRMQYGAEIVPMEGSDYRLSTATVLR